MEFTNTFTVQAPLPVVWDFMLDAQQVTPCVPGAQITEVVDATHYRGAVKIKLGAVQVTYRGALALTANHDARSIVLEAKGTEQRGSGGASGTVTATLVSAQPNVTTVEIHSRVDVTGRVAQFGRGIMQDVANRLIREFAACLEQKLAARAGAEVTTEHAGSVPATRPVATSAVSREEGSTNEPSRRPAASEAAVANELSMSKLLMDVVRSRAATWLRDLASAIEPR